MREQFDASDHATDRWEHEEAPRHSAAALGVVAQLRRHHAILLRRSRAHRLNQITTPSGQVIGYTYSNGRPSAITVNGSPLLSNVLYTPFGPSSGWNWSNGTLAVREYDLDGRVTTIDSAGLSTYEFNADGTIKSWADDSGALTGPTGLTELDVDPASNRLTESTGLDVRTYAYDAMGNITNDGTRSFTYNDAGRMVSATRASVATTYALNALGQRVKKTTSGSSTYFAYDEVGHLVGEYGNSGNLIEETVWFGDTPVATLRPNGGGVNLFYVHADHLNTPRRISRPSDNAVVWRWDSDPFGTTAVNDDPDGDSNPVAYNLRFPGQYFDPETGMHYNDMRDYDPAVARYVESDPIGLNGGLNTYAYVRSNPLSLADPSGLDSRAEPRPCIGCWYVPTRPPGGWSEEEGMKEWWEDVKDGARNICKAIVGETEEEKLQKRCQALKDSILNTCYGLKGRKRMACFEAANTSFRQCMGWE